MIWRLINDCVVFLLAGSLGVSATFVLLQVIKKSAVEVSAIYEFHMWKIVLILFFLSVVIIVKSNIHMNCEYGMEIPQISDFRYIEYYDGLDRITDSSKLYWFEKIFVLIWMVVLVEKLLVQVIRTNTLKNELRVGRSECSLNIKNISNTIQKKLFVKKSVPVYESTCIYTPVL